MRFKILILAIFFLSCSLLFGEVKKDDKSIKKIVDKDTEQVIIEVKKPDNASVISKKKTVFKKEISFNIKPIIKKSNKLLY